ncbi:meiotic recombination protein SPO11-like [Anneissia japonica]|uniref:meiotic recombination protein SPO11-like n=1 Tax=Anneissia japonica TaxID=1529436 RepID=UPI001425830A|nr:meiotic recombination protein SPO11-like [Anneissia japonica]
MAEEVERDDFWHNLDKLHEENILHERITVLSKENEKQADDSDKEGSSLRQRNEVLRKLEVVMEKVIESLRQWEAPVIELGNRTSWQNVRNEVLRKLEVVMEKVIESLRQWEAPVIELGNRTSWQNVSFSADVGLKLNKGTNVCELRFDAIKSTNRFAVTLSLMSECYKLVQSNTFSTKRDIYYNDPQLYGSQSVVDQLADSIACMLSVPRHHLHLLATSKGCLAGDLSFIEVDGNCINCSTSTTGILVPSHVEGLTNIRSDAKFILIIEKDATFQKLLDDGLLDRIQHCIIITGKGFPDINTRMMVKRLWDSLHLPIFGLVDADPHGIEILCVYKFGSKSYSFDSHNLTVPSIRWLGVLPSDVKRLQIPKDSLIPLTKADMDKASELIKRPYYTQIPKWMKEFNIRGGKQRFFFSLES